MATLLGHGVLMMPSLLAHGAGPAEGLLVRHSGMGWERIDGERDWAGALRLPAEVVHAALLDLGEWDPQATLLRVAVQRNAQQRQVATDEVAHGFDGGGAAVLMAADAERRVRRDDGLISLSVQRLLRPVAMRLSTPRRARWQTSRWFCPPGRQLVSRCLDNQRPLSRSAWSR